MEVKFNVIKEARKALVAAVSEITEVKAEYQGAPSFAFAVGGYMIDKVGTLTFGTEMDAADVRTLLMTLAERGFAFEGDIDDIAPAIITVPVATSCAEVDEANGDSEESPRSSDSFAEASIPETHDTLVIEVPRTGFTQTALDNLEKLVSSKADLILKAIGVPETPADDLPIEYTEATLRFPWFPLPASKDDTDAYTKFVFALCELAKKQKRVTMKDRDLDLDASDKFAFRCFLLRLGFVGDEYKSARRVLLSKLSGSGSFKSGSHKRRNVPVSVTAADSGVDNTEVISVREGGNNAGNALTGGAETVPARCSECLHHHYYTGGILRTNAGDIVDTSKRTPEIYTHYCLGTPSGFRRIKNGADWSGCESPATWCPLLASNNMAADSEEAAHG